MNEFEKFWRDRRIENQAGPSAGADFNAAIASLDQEISDLKRQLAEAGGLLNKLLSEARDAALVEAAKAMCPVCNDGDGISYNKVASVFRHQYNYRCDASEIHRLRAGKEGR